MLTIPIKRLYQHTKSINRRIIMPLKFELTTKQIAELCLYLSVPEMKQVIPEYLPSQRTIYRRLERFGILKPDVAKKKFEKDLIKAAPFNLTDKEAREAVEREIERRLVNLIEQIKRDAKAHEERLG